MLAFLTSGERAGAECTRYWYGMVWYGMVLWYGMVWYILCRANAGTKGSWTRQCTVRTHSGDELKSSRVLDSGPKSALKSYYDLLRGRLYSRGTL